MARSEFECDVCHEIYDAVFFAACCSGWQQLPYHDEDHYADVEICQNCCRCGCPVVPLRDLSINDDVPF